MGSGRWWLSGVKWWLSGVKWWMGGGRWCMGKGILFKACIGVVCLHI